MTSTATDTISTALHNIDTLFAQSMVGVNGGDLLLAVAVLAFAWAVRTPVARLILRLARSVIGGAGDASKDEMLTALEPPIRLLLVVAVALALNELLLESPSLRTLGEDLVRSTLTFALFWACYRVAPPVGRFLDRRKVSVGPELISWGVWIAQCLAVALGGAAILDIWGIRVGPMLAGLGLFGAAVALGAQDVFKNLIAGVFIIGEQRFRIGDWIKAPGVVEGNVEMIGLRTTRVRQFDLAPVYVPNSKLSDSPLINFAQMPYSRVDWMVTLDAGMPDAEARRIRDSVEALLKESADIVQPPAVPLVVRYEAYPNASAPGTGPRILVYAFLKTTDWAQSMQMREGLAFAIRALVADGGQVTDGTVQAPSSPKDPPQA